MQNPEIRHSASPLTNNAPGESLARCASEQTNSVCLERFPPPRLVSAQSSRLSCGQLGVELGSADPAALILGPTAGVRLAGKPCPGQAPSGPLGSPGTGTSARGLFRLPLLFCVDSPGALFVSGEAECRISGFCKFGKNSSEKASI